MDRTRRHLVLLVTAGLALSGCGDGTSPGVDAGVVPGADAGTDAASAVTPTCSYTLVDGETRTPWSGTIRARMNGSGNLLVVCQATDGSETELRIGNATFDGPRIYRMDDFLSDGTLAYDPGDSFNDDYRSDASGGSCTVDLMVAEPLDLRGDSVERGGRVAGTFTCSALVNDFGASPGSYTVEDGVFAATVE